MFLLTSFIALLFNLLIIFVGSVIISTLLCIVKLIVINFIKAFESNFKLNKTYISKENVIIFVYKFFQYIVQL